jgi:ubiquinone/menaquinone biosynthesis C-methylase UbiE
MDYMEEQTWWNNHIKENMESYKQWVGDEKAESKQYMANYLKNKNYKTLLDSGCGDGFFNQTLQNHHIDIDYTGVDTCHYFIELNKSKGIKIINSDIRKIPVEDNSYDIVFSRHTFEHQSNYKIILEESIRISKMETCIIFFIRPTLFEKIDYNETVNLYHNQYSRSSIEKSLFEHKKVKSWSWIDINEQECALHIYLI